MTKPTIDPVASAIVRVLETPNECDSNYEAANVVDGLFAIARAIRTLAVAIKPESAEVEKPTPASPMEDFHIDPGGVRF